MLVACRDTTHAQKIKAMIDSDAFFDGRYLGKVIEIDSSTGSAETEENIQKLLTIEKNNNPIEIVLHVYKLKEGWDVNNLFTIIPLNAAKSDILALQTIGRGLRLPFGEIAGVEELDTLDIVAHDHYREIIDDVKNNPIFKQRNLDEEDVEETNTVKVTSTVSDDNASIFEEIFKQANVTSFQQLDESKTEDLYKAYEQTFIKRHRPKKQTDEETGQMSLFDIIPELSQDATETKTEEASSTADENTATSIDIDTNGDMAKRVIPYVKAIFEQNFIFFSNQ